MVNSTKLANSEITLEHNSLVIQHLKRGEIKTAVLQIKCFLHIGVINCHDGLSLQTACHQNRLKYRFKIGCPRVAAIALWFRLRL